jgi:hypothetical protein
MAKQFLKVGQFVALVLGAVTILISSSAAQTMGSPERYRASAININNGTTGNIDITVNRWSTDDQRDKLIAVMLQKGPEKLLDAFEDLPPVGHFGVAGNLSWDLRFARRTMLPDGGEQVDLVTDRRIGFWESANQPRSIDYPFTVIELRLNADGTGEGKMSVATKVIHDKKNNTITLENYENQPVQLTNVKRERVTH